MVLTNMNAPFKDDPYHRLMQLVGALHTKARRFTECRLRPLNMTYPQLAALMALNRQDGVAQVELASSLETDATTVMVLCDSLEKRGWLTRAPDEFDRRVNRLFLTEAGRHAYAEARARLKKEDDYMSAMISTGELRRTIPVLEDLSSALEGFLERETGALASSERPEQGTLIEGASRRRTRSSRNTNELPTRPAGNNTTKRTAATGSLPRGL